MTAQQKMDAWKRQQMRAMDLAFQQRISEEIRKRLDEIILSDHASAPKNDGGHNESGCEEQMFGAE